MRYYQIVYRDFCVENPLRPMEFTEKLVSSYVPWEEGLYISNMSYQDNFALLVSGISEDPFVLLPDGSYLNKNNIYKILPSPNIRDENSKTNSSERAAKVEPTVVAESATNEDIDKNHSGKKWGQYGHSGGHKKSYGNGRGFRPKNRTQEKAPEDIAKEKPTDNHFEGTQIGLNNNFIAGDFE